MKTGFTKQIKLIAVLSLISISGYGQWQQSTSTTMGALNEVEFPAANAAYIAGFQFVYKSTDGGISWTTVLNGGPFANFTNLNFIDADVGFVNLYGTVYRTLDGGSSWTSIGDFQKVKICQNFLYTSYTSNGTTYIQKSTDYGDTWTVLYQHSEINARPYLVSFVDSNNAYFINPNELDRVYKTNDGFLTIETLLIANGDLVLQEEYDFKDLNNGYLYGTGGSQSYPTRTYPWATGTYYFPINLDGFGVLPVLDLDFNTSFLYASSLYGKIFYSQDDGQTWTEQSPPTSDPIYSIAFLNNNKGIAISGNNVFYTNNGGMGLQERNTIQKSLIVYPNPAKENLYLKTAAQLSIEKIKLFDMRGKTVREYPFNSRQLDISNLAPGNYFLQLQLNGRKVVERIVVK